MELTYWILICFAIITIMFFSFFTWYQHKIIKDKKTKDRELKKYQLKQNEIKKEELLNNIDNLINEILLAVDNFDPTKSKITLKEIKDYANTEINNIKNTPLYKELKIQDPKWIKNLLINKLEQINPANWRKKFSNELKKRKEIIYNGK